MKKSSPAAQVVTAFLLCLLPSLLLLELFLSYHSIPIPLGDQLYFYPAALYQRHFGLLLNPIRNVAGEVELVWHGWLHPVLYSHLSPTDGLNGILISEDLLVVATLLLFFLGLHRSNGLSLASILMYCFGCLTLLLANNGRPEMLVCLLLLLWMHTRNWLVTRINLRMLLDGAFAGCIFAANPNCAVIVAVLMMLRIAHTSYEKRWSILKYCSLYILSSALTVFLLCQLLYSFSLLDWLHGLYTNLTVVVELQSSSDSFGYYYFYNLKYPLLIGWFMPLAICLQQSLIQIKTQKMLLLMSLPLIAFLIWFTFLRTPERSYYLVAFAPACTIATCEILKHWSLPMRKSVQIAMIVLCLFTSLGLLRRFSKGVLSYAYGVSIAEASSQVVPQYEQLGERLGLSHPLGIALFGSPPQKEIMRKILVAPPFELAVKSSKDTIVLAQPSSGQHTAPTLNGFQLTEDRFYRGPKSFAGIQLFNTPNSYNYAVYRRQTN